MTDKEIKKWCEGCLVKIKPGDTNCSYCGKSTDVFYTEKDFDSNGELLMKLEPSKENDE